MCVHAYRDQRLMSRLFLDCYSTLLFLRHDSLIQLISSASWTQDFLFPPSEAGITDRLPHPSGIHKGFGDLNSGPLACMNSSLITKPYAHLLSVAFDH